MSQCLNSVLNLFVNKKLVMEVTFEHMMTSSDHYQRINVVVGNKCVGLVFKKYF